MMNLPKEYISAMQELLGDEFNAYLNSFQDGRLYGLRVNTLKISVADFLKICPFDLKPIPWIENGFYFQEQDKPAKHPYYFAGLYYIQEPSAMTPANILPVESGDVVYDMCAAPGGKSTELGAKLERSGLLVTNDISNSRAKALLKNIEVFGIPNICVISEDPKKTADRFHEFFDKVLIDAPCSGEGMFRKDGKLIKSWEKNGPSFYSKIQRELVLLGADMLKPGGKMLYSTCTFSTLENEETIRYLLQNRPQMHLLPVKDYEGFAHGFAKDDEARKMQLMQAVRIFPHKMAGEGHFIALLEKEESGAYGGVNPDRALLRTRQVKIPAELEEFLCATTYPVDRTELVIREDKVYLVPKQMPDDVRLRIMRSGLLLGELKKNRFEPSQAFAMALKKEQYDKVIDLPVSDERIIRYLKGETVDIADKAAQTKDGWNLFCVDGYPLGWGKVNGTVLKNKYLAGWRYQ